MRHQRQRQELLRMREHLLMRLLPVMPGLPLIQAPLPMQRQQPLQGHLLTLVRQVMQRQQAERGPAFLQLQLPMQEQPLMPPRRP